MIRYKECQRNHAAHLGGHVLDGCGEFMPAGPGEDGTPETLKCAACECHRNFHRREVTAGAPTTPTVGNCYISFNNNNKPQKHQPIRHRETLTPPLMVAFGGGGESSGDDLTGGNFPAEVAGTGTGKKKRFRTKFTGDQKVKMGEFAERIGWRILKENEEDVRRICEEVGIQRQVFKVWLHNNKIKRKPT